MSIAAFSKIALRSLVLSLFLGLGALAFMTLFALTPVSYGEYVAYEKQVEEQKRDSRVAGLSTTTTLNVDYEFTNPSVIYQTGFQSTYGEVSAQFPIGVLLFEDDNQTLKPGYSEEFITIYNYSNQVREYELELVAETLSDFDIVLDTPTNNLLTLSENSNLYTIRINPNESEVIKLKATYQTDQTQTVGENETSSEENEFSSENPEELVDYNGALPVSVDLFVQLTDRY